MSLPGHVSHKPRVHLFRAVKYGRHKPTLILSKSAIIGALKGHGGSTCAQHGQTHGYRVLA